MSDDPRAFSRHPFAAVLSREEMVEMVRGVQCGNAPWPFMIEYGEPIRIFSTSLETETEHRSE
jgi:hypothetical protein